MDRRAKAKAELEARLAELYAAYIAAKKVFESNRTPEAQQAVHDAWKAYDAAGPKRKRGGYASRAGQRQAAERNALYRRRR